MTAYKRVATLRNAQLFQNYLTSLGIDLPFDATVEHGADAPLAQPLATGMKTVGNRFAVLPMEGWDGELDGRPSELTLRRWRRFGQSGAKLIAGGEAVAVRFDGRANPNQLISMLSARFVLRDQLPVTIDQEQLPQPLFLFSHQS